MAGMGPPPKATSRHRGNDTLSTSLLVLPVDGRVGDEPLFPLSRPTAPERRVWSELWATPQAFAWERMGWTRSVARYVRSLVQAEKPGAAASLLGEVRQMEDRLGLSPMSMLRLRWTVGEVEDDRPAGELFVIPDEWLDAGSG